MTHLPRRLAFSATVGLSAALLFLIQPLWTRITLARLGGSPAVWNTAMVLFQALLLAGYAYAHWMARCPGIQRVRAIHGLVVALGLLSLPPTPPSWLGETASPMLGLLWATLLTLGPLFFALTSTSPLLQTWFSRSGGDPYFLYAASNAGSLLGLLLPPLLDPWIGVHTYVAALAVGAGVWAVGVAWCLWRAWVSVPSGPSAPGAPTAAPITDMRLRSPSGAATDPREPASGEPETHQRGGLRGQGSWRATARWVILAALPAAVLVAVTTWLASTAAAVPLLWVLPLALYLLSFIVVFAARRPPQALLERTLPLLATPVAVVLALEANHPTSVIVPLHLACVTAVFLACHGRLAEERPAPSALTRFYLAQSLGGVVGGTLAALAAPLVLDVPWEYPLGLAGAVAVATPASTWRWPGLALLADLAKLGVLVAVAVGLAALGPIPRTLGFTLAALGLFLLSRQRLRYATGWIVLLVVAAALPPPGVGRTLLTRRSFFGQHRVANVDGFRVLFHGITVHGRQALRERDGCHPLLYYHPTGPIGQLFRDLALPAEAHVGGVGLGAGSLACYARPGQHWTFFEIDPSVDAIARDPNWFTYLQHAAVPVETVVGDARISLQRWAGPRFDLLVLDAYSSDSIPMHLLTAEAMELYRARLTTRGLVALHISNRYFDLGPAIGALAEQGGWAARMRDDGLLSTAELLAGKSESRWVVMTQREANLGSLAHDPRWQPLPSGGPLWTDDKNSAMQALVLD